MSKVGVGVVALSALAGSGLMSSAAGATPRTADTHSSFAVVASGLNNPRGVAFADGRLYVAEAGTGGTDCPAGLIGPEGGPLCVGRTGALADITNGTPHDVLSGLFSESDLPGGLAAEGISNVAGSPRGLRALYGASVDGLVTALPHGATLLPADSTAARAQLGRLTDVSRGGQESVIADVGDSNFSWSAVHQDLVPTQFPDANPNALAIVGDTTYVVDAASNTLDSVDRRGNVTQLAFLPNTAGSDAVPTCVAAGPRGDLYIGQLAPFTGAGQANVYRYDPVTHSLSVWKTGFSAIDGCGFDRAGNFYAVEFQASGFNPGPGGLGDPAGDIVKIARNGTRTVLGAGQLFFPQGFALGRDGSIYVSNWSIFTGSAAHPGDPTGQVVRLGP